VQPNSIGTYFHGMPVRKTYTMPVSREPDFEQDTRQKRGDNVQQASEDASPRWSPGW
jgi:hypothetical protein